MRGKYFNYNVLIFEKFGNNYDILLLIERSMLKIAIIINLKIRNRLYWGFGVLGFWGFGGVRV